MSDLAQKVILIVEDNPDNSLLAIEIVDIFVKPRAIHAVDSGAQLFVWLDQNPDLHPNLILLDIRMPHQDGYSILRDIRTNPHCVGTQVVAMTANIMPVDIEKAREAGFDGFIGKPVDFHRFPQQVERILAGEQVWEAR